MLHITAILEDNQIVLTNTGDDKWRGTICDGHSGQQIEVEVPGDVLSAAMALALHNDGTPVDDETTQKLYDICEPWHLKYGMQPGGPNVKLRIIP